MQDIVFYAAANETLGVVRDYANSRNEYAPTLVLGVSVCLRMRLFAGSESAAPYPVDAFSGITSWKWRMDSDFDRETPYKLTADSNGISVQTVTDTIDGETLSFTEFAIRISDMNTLELATWLGTEKKKTGLTGELVGYDSSGNAVFVLQIDDFTVRNRLAGLNEPTSNDQEYLTRSETENLVSSAAAAKQDKLTSANAGAGIAIDSGGTISMACVILGATNGVKIADGKAQFDVTTAPVRGGTVAGVLIDVADGLQVSGGTASIDDASVQDTLVGLEGGTASINDEVVTPGNLRGALSLGQAVDVSCAATRYTTGVLPSYDPDFLSPFTVDGQAAGAGKQVVFGFYTGGLFPKRASGLKYLLIADVCNTGCALPAIGNYGQIILLNGNGHTIPGAAVRVPADKAYDAYTRVARVFGGDDTDLCFLIWNMPATDASAVEISIKNWRQYEVTALTDEAIEYLAGLPDPDAFFRSTSVFSVRDKYLVKQDMVCPWIKTIGMPDNSDLTVAAGLSYSIKYTNNNAHKITVDTIPQDAYGRDAHIQMFVKGASAVQFQPPLVLMDALTPNAGHNLLVKFRNGQALVYVDDLNAGYIVVSPTGSTDGTLAYGLTMTPANVTDDKYIVFGSTVNGLVCDFGTVTPVYGATATAINVLGNGSDQTTITGTLTVPSGKNVNLQDLTISGSTFSGAGTTVLSSTTITDGMEIGSGSTLTFNGTNTLNSTLSGAGEIVFANGAVLTSDIPGGATIGTGVITGMTNSTSNKGMLIHNVSGVIENIAITGNTLSNTGGLFRIGSGIPYKLITIKNCYIDNVVSSPRLIMNSSANSKIEIIGCTIRNGTADGGATIYASGGPISITDSDAWAFAVHNGILEIRGTVNTGRAIAVGTVDSSAGELRLLDGSKLILVSFTSQKGTACIKIGSYDSSGNWTPSGTATIVCSGHTETLSGCTFSSVNQYGAIIGTPNIILGDVDTWSADNAVFGSPLDASTASTVKLADTTFTSGSLISGQPVRIQLVAGTTISLSGNTNAADTKILQAPVMVVGNDPASPSGSATIVASGATPTVTGIGTYVAKDGSNDFTAISNVNSVTVSSGASTVASSLASALALATSSGGINRWVKLANGLMATATYADGATVTDKRIVTAEYELVLAGNFSFSSGAVVTVNETTRTTTVAGGITLSSVCIPKGATVKVSGGSLAIDYAGGAGGTIELAGSAAIQMTSGTIGRVTISSGAIVDITSGIVPDDAIILYGGASLSPTTIVCGGSSRIFEDVEIRGATISDQGIIYGATVYSNVGDDHYIYFTEDDGATSSSVIITGATEYVVSGGLMRIVGT